MSLFSRITAACLAMAVGFFTTETLAQSNVLTSTGTPGISVSGGLVYFADPGAEFCSSQRVRNVTVGGGSGGNLINFLGGCPMFGQTIRADGGYVFMAAFTGPGQSVVRLWTGGANTGLTTLLTPPIGNEAIIKLDTTPQWVYWQTASWVGRIGRDGTSPTQIVRQPFTSRIGLAAAGNGLVYWCQGNEIWRADFSAPVPALFASGSFNAPVHLVADATHLYWAEVGGVIRRTTLTPGGPVTTIRNAVAGGYSVQSLLVDGTHAYLLESATVGTARIFKVPLAGGTAVQVGPGNLPFARSLQQDVDQLYWVDGPNGDIRRIRKDAAAIQPDFDWLGLEVTQGIQNMANDVPLVRGKPTLVRGYPRSSLGGYPNVTAQLHGVRTSNGQPMPGSPLRSTVAALNVPQGGDLNDARRLNLGGTFNWEVPGSWLNNSVTFTATINFDNSISESITGNNSISAALQVHDVPPVCIKLRRTRTEAPTYEAYGTDFNNVINRYRTLTPARDVWIYPQSGIFEEIECCTWYPPHVYWGKWEVNDDKNQMIVQLINEATFASNLSQCDAVGAETHRVAMIHPDTYTGESSGFANYVWNVSYVQFNTNGQATYFYPSGGAILAQEIAHNHNGWPLQHRWDHVDCGSPEGINPDYPYFTDAIGLPGSLNHYGFDPISRAVIRPTDARDYMSYCNPRWTSDYSWLGMMDQLNSNPLPAGPPPSGDYLMAIGFIDDGSGQAEVLQVHHIFAGTMPVADLTRLLAQQSENTGIIPAYRLELRNAAGFVVGTQDFDATVASHEHGDEKPIFAILMPDHPAGASVTVKDRASNGTMGSLAASANAPVVTAIISPTHSQTITNAVNISWTASDADGDTLTYIVQYTRDSGAKWEVLAANTPNTFLNLEATELLPGSATTGLPGSSHIRIIASDGFRTGIRTSAPFLVTNRAPIATITLPANGARFGAGETIRFSGVGFDPEIGRLDSAVYLFEWSINGGPPVYGHEFIDTDGFAPGTYTATLVVRDAMTSPGITSITFYVGDGPPPPADVDSDGVPDVTDNCSIVFNPDQTDTDADGVGNQCDNCPLLANPDQGDLDDNGYGNACDNTRLYVNAAATGLNSGLSWANAYTSLESALAATDTLPAVRDIWVAQGRYVPTARSNAAVPRSATFRLRPNVSIYGGFVGYELHAEDADPRAHPTILSGDVLNDDGPAPGFTNRGDNVYTVFTCNASTIIEGLVFTKGNASGINPSVGGGVHITASAPDFRRCDFISNQGGPNSGGGAHANLVGSPIFRHCRFLGNTVIGYGAGAAIYGGAPQFLNCLFVDNRATGVASRGGAVATFSSTPSFVNCTVASNHSQYQTGGLHIAGNSTYAASVTNCVAFFNTDTNGSVTGPLAQVRTDGGAAANVAYSCVQGGYAGQNISADPQFVDLNGADNIFGTTDDQPRPAQGSPVNDAGANAYALSVPFDLEGLPRRVNDPNRPDTGLGSAPIVDMGAFEWQPPPPCPADFDGNGLREVSDIFAFLSAWFANDPRANFDQMGGIAVPDIFAFLSAWFAGC